MNSPIFPDFVADGTTAGAHCAADQGTFTAAEKTSHDCSACGRASDDFQARMMPVIMSGLGGLCTLVGGLGEGDGRDSKG